jgi:hypothetical protein
MTTTIILAAVTILKWIVVVGITAFTARMFTLRQIYGRIEKESKEKFALMENQNLSYYQGYVAGATDIFDTLPRI